MRDSVSFIYICPSSALFIIYKLYIMFNSTAGDKARTPTKWHLTSSQSTVYSLQFTAYSLQFTVSGTKH